MKMRIFFDKKELLKRYIFLILLIVSKLALEITYYFYISPKYTYMGLGTAVSEFKLLESYILLIPLFVLTPMLNYKVTHFFLNIQLIVTVLPMLSYYWLNDQSRIYMYAVCICHLLECILIKINLIKNNINFPGLSNNCIFQLLFIGVILTIFYCLFQYGIPKLTALNFNNVYEMRSATNWRFPFSYIIPWCAKIFIPIGIVISLKQKKYVNAVIMQICLLILYLLFPHKTFLFIIFFVVAVYFACYKNFLYASIYLIIPFVSLSGTVIYKITNNIAPISYLVRRVFFVPAQLKFAYYDFFSQNPKYGFADGLIGNILEIDPHYNNSIAKMIGSYMGNNSSANTGYLGESYAQAGFIGMLILSVILVIFLKILELCTYKKDCILVISAASYWLYNLNDAALLTSLLTGGGLILIFLFVFSERHKKEVKLE